MAAIKIPVDGLSKLAAAFAGGGDDAYNEAFQKEAVGQSRIGASIASARLNNAKADAEEQAAALQRPDAIRSNAMTGLGIPQEAVDEVQQFLSSGRIDKYKLGQDQAGPVAPAPDWTSKLGNLGRLIASTQNAVTLGDKNSENVAGAYGKFDNLDKQDRVIAGSLPASTLGQAVAASAGKPLYDIKEFGSGNVYTGAVDDSNPVAKRYGTYRNSETTQNNAQAGASRASAANSYASANQHKAQTDLVKSKIGQSQTTTLPDGTVVTTGGANPPKLTELQGKAQLFGARAAEADRIINSLEGQYSPAAINTKQGLEDIPVLGGALGSAGNYFLTEPGQKAEQAQRDFINAVLRLESGAAIAPSEFENAKRQYFPQPNDKPSQIEQKRRNRETAINGLRTMAGPAAGAVQPRQQNSNRNIKVDF